MSKKDWFGIGYVSAWVLIWGTIGSLIDLPFLNSEIFLPGSIGQVTTFIVTAIISVIIGVLLYPKVLENTLIISALGLDTDEKKKFNSAKLACHNRYMQDCKKACIYLHTRR